MDTGKPWTWTEAERRNWADALNAREAAMSDFDLLSRYGQCCCGAPRMALAEVTADGNMHLGGTCRNGHGDAF